jgi:hypothetical protein
MMRYFSIVIAATLAVGTVTAVSAQQTADYNKCFALSEQKGAGVKAGRRNHNQFMQDCLAGKVPQTRGVPAIAFAPAPTATIDSFNKCFALAEERGSGIVAGNRTHRTFMDGCMAGSIR